MHVRIPYILAGMLIGLAFVPVSTSALQDIQADPYIEPRVEMIVIEAKNCIYCKLFRRDVLPGFRSSKHADEVSIRFLDINELEDKSLQLQHEVQIVPTFVVVSDNREIGRIPGYIGPTDFYYAIGRVIERAP